MNEKIQKGREDKVNNSIERYKEVLDAFITIVNYYFINNKTNSKVFELPDYSNEFWEALEKVCEKEGFHIESTFSGKKVKIYLNSSYTPFEY